MKERHSLKSKAGRREARAHFLKIHYVQPWLYVCERVCCFQIMKTELKASSVYSPLAFICSIIFHLHLDFFPSLCLSCILYKQITKSNQAAQPHLFTAACYSTQPLLVSGNARADHVSIQTGMLS